MPVNVPCGAGLGVPHAAGDSHDIDSGVEEDTGLRVSKLVWINMGKPLCKLKPLAPVIQAAWVHNFSVALNEQIFPHHWRNSLQ